MTRKTRPVIGSRLSGLVAGVDTLGQPATTSLSTALLDPGEFQPRYYFNPDALEDLTRSVREQGVLQPLLVRPTPGGRYEIVAGERRWRAARQAGLSEVPVLIRTLSDSEARLAAAVENLQREDLNVMEEVRAKLQVAAVTLGVHEDSAVARLFALDRHPESDPDLIGKLDAAFGALGRESWRSFIRNRAALLNLPEELQEAVRTGLDYRKALVIGRAPTAEQRERMLEAAANGATVVALRQLLSGPDQPGPDVFSTVARQLRDRKGLARLEPRQRARAEKLLLQLSELLSGEGSDTSD
ncbi:putative plasmid-partitioning protein ParB [Deinococcus seoulensis]|uniref:Plasmid-partitioning protein ParB n=2 Tax=Deinococcus TaxID=1298 RepID=A0ABQ2RT68_9DEIO|nr:MULTISPECIES: ParB/RepB/Spo0J family partition protein [Deinococcus]GGR64637.1 putative plasmid-partitioning protein ParB [Deinococcus seoulensis]GGS22108.1 putative plasmid-partitioning protein ParB [Deinococcus knuensis]